MNEHTISLRSPFESQVGPIVMKCWECSRQNLSVVKCGACGVQLCARCVGDHFAESDGGR